MYECIKPTQYIKEHEDDFLIFKGNRWYVHTYYGGVAEITKETFDKLVKEVFKKKDKYFVRLTTDEVQEIDEMTYLNLGGVL